MVVHRRRLPDRHGRLQLLSASPLAHGLRAEGCAAVEEVPADVLREPRGGEVAWFLGAPNWYRLALRTIAARPPELRPTVVFWHYEPLPFARGSGVPRPRLEPRELAKILLHDARATDVWTNARHVRGLARRGLVDLLVVSSEAKREYLAEHDVPAAVVPLGYHEPTHGRLLGLERDVDVLFLGAPTRRRARALASLRRAGLRVQAAGSWTDQSLWREGRTRLLNRTKVLLNLSRHAGQFSGQRFMLGMANGAAVVSEPIHRPAPFRPGEHYVEAPLDAMPAAVQRLLDDDGERERLAARGHELVTQEVTIERSVARVLAALEERLERGR